MPEGTSLNGGNWSAGFVIGAGSSFLGFRVKSDAVGFRKSSGEEERVGLGGGMEVLRVKGGGTVLVGECDVVGDNSVSYSSPLRKSRVLESVPAGFFDESGVRTGLTCGGSFRTLRLRPSPCDDASLVDLQVISSTMTINFQT